MPATTTQPRSRATANPDSALTRVATPNRPLLYEVTGKGDPLVLMPGSLTGWLSWVAHAKRLAERHRVVRA